MSAWWALIQSIAFLDWFKNLNDVFYGYPCPHEQELKLALSLNLTCLVYYISLDTFRHVLTYGAMHFALFFLIGDDEEALESPNESENECPSSPMHRTPHTDQPVRLPYNAVVQLSPIRLPETNTSPKSRLALRRHNGKYIRISPGFLLIFFIKIFANLSRFS